METTQFIEVSWTSGSLDEARKVARYLVQERLVACAQIIPWLESVYMWDNQLETTQESKITLKTTRDRFDQIAKIIQENSGYQVPEVTFRTIDGGNKVYMDWLAESVNA